MRWRQEIIFKWIVEKDSPAEKLNGVWEADAEMIVGWRKNQ